VHGLQIVVMSTHTLTCIRMCVCVFVYACIVLHTDPEHIVIVLLL